MSGEGATDGATDGAGRETAGAVAGVIAAVRSSGPLVQCITNSVVTGFTANVLLAAGAAPAMVDIRGEAGGFATVASALLVNLGTPHAEQQDAAREAAAAAAAAGTPWVLDPVAVGALPVRTALAVELLAHAPTVVRGNASEVMALAGAGAGGRGVDSTAGPDDAVPAAADLLGRGVRAVAVSGPVDVVVGPAGTVRLTGGDSLLTRVTGTGCALGALVAACTAVTDDPALAALAGSAWTSVAAERAVAVSRRPGSFAVAFLDAIDAVGAGDGLAAALAVPGRFA